MTKASEAAEAAQRLTWLKAAEDRFQREVGQLPDAELRADSALPGWTRAHVVAHLARNAEALSRLLSWARTGTKQSMYPDMDARNRDIEASASQEADALRTDFRMASTQLAADFEALPENKWSARVRTFHGRDIPASEVVWMRAREVWLHLVDLGTGVGIDSWPDELVNALLDDVTATMSAREDAPTVLLSAIDRDRQWRIGSVHEPSAEDVRGSAADLLSWLTGRSSGQGLVTAGPLPALPHWM